VDPSKFFCELKRRNVYRAAVGYAAVAWLIIQVVTQVAPVFEIPSWVVRSVIVLLLAGAPVALVVAWAFELTPEGFVRAEEAPAESSRGRAFGRKLNAVIIVVLAVAVAVLLVDRFRPNRRTGTGDAPEKSIAVLPFDNMSNDPENAFFADGIQDDILTSLAKIAELKVISRTSTLPYRGGKSSHNLRQIADALGVATVLEGSVRRAGAQVAVTVQLIDAATDRHVWAHRYDRTISNALTLQGELAQEIASALHAKLSPEEKARVETKPTDHPDAYVHYLRARQLEQGPDNLLQDFLQAEDLLTKAVALDPQFALAFALRAKARADIFHFHQAVESWKAKAWLDAREALRLQPNASETHHVMGLCFYWLDGDYERALEQFGVASGLAPNDTNPTYFTAAIRRRQGKWQEALDTFQRIESLDPQNPNIARNILFTHTAMRNWAAAGRAGERLAAIAPDSVSSRVQAAYVDFWANGTTENLRRVLDSIPPDVDPDGVVTASRWDVALIDRDFERAENAIRQCKLEELSYFNGELTPKEFFVGMIALARGDAVAAQPFFDTAVTKFETAVREGAESAERHANLGLVYALIGRKEAAIAEGRRAVELKPEAKDAFDGAIMNCVLALIYARVGEADEALALIERLLKTHGAVDSALYSITTNDLRFRWVWEPLRGDPRFEQLLAR
jgi:TolB-like protein/Tfp pilus assembly protein PilF